MAAPSLPPLFAVQPTTQKNPYQQWLQGSSCWLSPDSTHDYNHPTAHSNYCCGFVHSWADSLSWRCGIVCLGVDRQHDFWSVVEGASDTSGAFSQVLLVYDPLLLAPISRICRNGCDRPIPLAGGVRTGEVRILANAATGGAW